MDAYVAEWLNLLFRWLHFTAGIAWIGSSFYFIWLDNHLEPAKPEDAARGVYGEIWSVHGGGFYHNRKYLLGPERLPETLHWFKWEAYFTWISGMALMAVVYYWGAETYLLDRDVAELTPLQGIAISVGSLIVSWVVYDLLCKSPLGNNGLALLIVGFVLVLASSWGFAQVFSGRAAYLHVGAMIGTIMVWNVFFVIIPGQRKLVDAVKAGQKPDPEPGLKGKQRSVHNNYLTLPVLFIMISNHYPMTYGHDHAWAVLGAMVVAGVLIRHFFNLRHKGKVVIALPAAATVVVVGLAVAIVPKNSLVASIDPSEIDVDQVKLVINERCLSCHAAKPTQEGFKSPPAGVVLETPGQLKRWATRINLLAVERQTMPAGNVTEMTDQERALLGKWFRAGAPTD